MKPLSLVDAALLDQEQRILAAKPTEIVGVRERTTKTKPCPGGCGRQVSAQSRWRCAECRMLKPNGWTASVSSCGPDDVDAR